MESVHLTDSAYEAMLSLNSKFEIPSDLDAQVHSQSAVGEQYITLLPRNDARRPLRDGDVIPRTALGTAGHQHLLDAANRGLQAIPQDNLKTMIDEADTAIGGLGPEISRIVQGSTALAIDARASRRVDDVIDQSGPLMDSQSQTADSIRGWAAHLATISGELRRMTPRSPACWTVPRRRSTRRSNSWNGYSRRCRSCWPTWSAWATSRSPTSRRWNSCWFCCPRASR